MSVLLRLFLESHMVDSYIFYVEHLHQVASFPFDDHNCPPIQLITSFCQSAYLWLKEDIENVVVVHCKAGMARTGLMISSLLLYLKVRYMTSSLIKRNWKGHRVTHFCFLAEIFSSVDSFSILIQFFPTAEESIDYYNQKRCFDAKGLVLPSQIVG
jgi:phosphatidylinositol-3,4,5-trisphosphate 3-phosphatase/dual-specificity protein phosphatase PTEN